MQAKIKIGDLREAITQASYTLDSKASSVGSWIYLIAMAATEKDESRMYVYTSNLGMARTLLKIPADVIKSGYALIVPRLLGQTIGNLPAEEEIEIGLSASGAKLQVKYGTLKSEIAVHADGQKASEVLSSIPFNAKPCFTVSAATLVDLINRTAFCTASGSNAITEGPWLSSVLLEASNGALVGTATNRIIAGQCEVHDPLVTSVFSGGIHRDALVALKAILSRKKEEEVTVTNATSNTGATNEILFRFSDAILGIRQLAKPYPKAVAKIFTVPGEHRTATINRAQLINVLARLSAYAEKGTLSLTFNGSTVVCATRGYGSAFQESVAKTEKSEGPTTVGLGLSDLSNVLSVMKSEDVVFRYGSDSDHIHVQEGESNFKYVLSPAEIEWGNKGKK